jgi:superfamily II DNA or RNA helicase
VRLHDYQVDSINRSLSSYKEGANSVLMQSSTGSGKTLMALVTANELVTGGDKILWTCHRKTLIEQARTACKALGLDKHKFVFQCDKTAAMKAQKGQYALTVFDEAHRSMNPTQQKIWELSELKLGLSATPIRLDKTPLDDHYCRIVFGIPTGELINKGALSHYVIEGNSEFDRKALNITEFDSDRQIAIKCKKAITTQQILDCYLGEATPANHTMVFVSSIEQCEEVTELMRASCINAVQAHSKEKLTEYNIEQFKEGNARVLVNVDIATEGFDVPSTDLVICARVTTSISLWIQIIGRVMRRYEGKDLGRIVDLTDNHRIYGKENGIDLDWLDWESYMEIHNKKKESSPREILEPGECIDYELRPADVDLVLSASSGLTLDDLRDIPPYRANEIQHWLSNYVGWWNSDREWLLSSAATMGDDYIRVIKRRLGMV